MCQNLEFISAETVNRNIEPSTYSANKTGSRHNNQEPSKIHSSNNKNSNPNSKGCSGLKEVVSGNKKFKKDLMNEKIKSQDSPKRTFLKKKLKDKHQPRVPPNDGKLKQYIAISFIELYLKPSKQTVCSLVKNSQKSSIFAITFSRAS